jgi:hypothetical protein
MKKSFLIVVGILISVVLSPQLFRADSVVVADLAGCCMQRQTLNAQWFRNGLNFTACQQLKNSLDHNNQIFVQGGLVWWNQTC